MPKHSKETKHKTKMKEKFKKNSKSLNKIKSKNASTNPDRDAPGFITQQSTLRTKATIKRLNMYREKPDYEKMRQRPKDSAVRIQPDRKWFGNVRTIDQKALEKFRSAVEEKQSKPIKANEILISKKKLPMSLLVQNKKETRQNKTKLLKLENYESVFGPKKQRKKPKLEVYDTEQLANIIETRLEQYELGKDQNYLKGLDVIKDEEKDRRMEAGQSKRIWEELTKVIDASDVICQVIDARDPMGTRSKHIEKFLQKKYPSKHLVLILNKIDLIPISITKKWIRILAKDLPTVAYHANINNPFGKGSLINLFRQFDNFHKDKQTMSIGFIGYPNVGKSSVINSIKHKKVCKAAPVPGETKVWQYIHLTKRIYMIDCPGIVYNYEGLDLVQNVLKSVIRAERLTNAEDFVGEILKLVKREKMEEIYGITNWETPEQFVEALARKNGRLLKGGGPDVSTTAKKLIYDWQSGSIPYFVPPPNMKEEKESLKVDKLIEEQISKIEEEMKEVKEDEAKEEENQIVE